MSTVFHFIRKIKIFLILIIDNSSRIKNDLNISFSESDRFPLRDEQDKHDKDFLKHHDEDIEDTLAQPRCALHGLSYMHMKKRHSGQKKHLSYSDMQHKSLLQ